MIYRTITRLSNRERLLTPREWREPTIMAFMTKLRQRKKHVFIPRNYQERITYAFCYNVHNINIIQIRKRETEIWQMTNHIRHDIFYSSETYSFFYISFIFSRNCQMTDIRESEKETLHCQFFWLLIINEVILQYIYTFVDEKYVFQLSHSINLTFNRPTSSMNSCSFFVSCIAKVVKFAFLLFFTPELNLDRLFPPFHD